MTTGSRRLPVEYLVPLRWSDDADLPEFTDYLRRLAVLVDVTVVDGSEPRVFDGHAARWGELVRHLPVGQWVGERAVTVWLAVFARLRGGVRCRGERMPRAGTRLARGERRDGMGLAA